MGASASCQLFESFSTVLQWILNEKFQIKGALHLLGDFFFVGEAQSLTNLVMTVTPVELPSFEL
jgi:hypothetical protein